LVCCADAIISIDGKGAIQTGARVAEGMLVCTKTNGLCHGVLGGGRGAESTLSKRAQNVG
jgi:hypothetical protein